MNVHLALVLSMLAPPSEEAAAAFNAGELERALELYLERAKDPDAAHGRDVPRAGSSAGRSSSLPLSWVLLLPDSWQALFGLGVASWAVLLATMLLVMFMGCDPRTSHGLVGAAAGQTMAILHCVFVGSLA